MNTRDILSIISQDSKIKPILEGVVARDKLPSKKLPMAIIANTDTGDGPGEHWIGMYFPVAGKAMYWDSYGMPPHHKEFLDYLGDNYHYNDVQLQSPFSSACGQHSIFFLAMTSRGCNVKQIQNCFGRNLADNDQLVTEFINRNYNVNTRTYHPDYLIEQISRYMNDVLSK